MRNLLHGKLRTDLRLKINKAAVRREKAVHEGKLTKAIKCNKICKRRNISTGDHILNSGPQSVLQAEGLLISKDAGIAEPSDH